MNKPHRLNREEFNNELVWKMNIEKLKKQYKDEWVLVEVLKADKLGQPTEVKLIAHSKNRDDIYEALKKVKVKDVATFYTGKIPKKGYAVAF